MGCGFLDIERIHIGAQSNRRTVTMVAFERADDTGSRHSLIDFDTKLGQFLGDKSGGLMLFKGSFRMGVDMTPPFG